MPVPHGHRDPVLGATSVCCSAFLTFQRLADRSVCMSIAYPNCLIRVPDYPVAIGWIRSSDGSVALEKLTDSSPAPRPASRILRR